MNKFNRFVALRWMYNIIVPPRYRDKLNVTEELCALESTLNKVIEVTNANGKALEAISQDLEDIQFGAGGYYRPAITENGNGSVTFSFTASDDSMPPIEEKTFFFGDMQTITEMLEGFSGDPKAVKNYIDEMSGGYYTPVFEQDGNTISVSFRASNKMLPALDGYSFALPSGGTGKSAYGSYLDNGGMLSEKDWVNSLKGEDGESFYQMCVKNGFKGSETDLVIAMKGVGIQTVEKTSTSGLVDTYTITLTDNTTATFTVTNANAPVAGVDYPSIESIDKYIEEELAKRNQFVPIPAASVEGMTDTTKIYYLTATGELYAYAPTQVVVGGYTNLADPAAEGWQNPARINESGAITTGSATGSFVTPIYPAKAGQKIYIKGVKEIDTSMRRFRVVTYDESGSVLYPAAYKLIGSANLSEVGTVVTVSDDGVYCWTIGQLKTGDMHDTASRIAGVRVTGGAIDGDDNVVITIDEPIVEPIIETVYQWSGTGHFISSEEAVTALESRVNVLEDEVEGLTVTVDRLKTNSSISMQSGAVWYALGDSITQGYASRVNASTANGYDQYVAAEGKRWVDYVAALNGYKLTNYGVGGTGYAHRTDNARAQVDGIDFSGCDLVTLAYGINDFKNAGTNIGSMDDDIQTGGTFVSNMRYCIIKILADNPLCKIIVITPLNYRGLGTYSTNYSIGYTGTNASCANLDYMVGLMEQVCKYHGVEMIDMTHSSIVNRENIVALLPDYVHPSEDCHRVLGYELARRIEFA